MIKVDFHAHPTLQPYSEYQRLNQGGSIEKSSIWYYNPPNRFKKFLNRIAGITSSSQSNFVSVAKGNVNVIGVALYPPEISFFTKKLPNIFDNGLERILKRYSIDRIHEIESGTYSYFKELTAQYRYMVENHLQPENQSGFTSTIAKSFKDIETVLAKGPGHIASFFCIEGAHSLNAGYPDFWEGELSTRQKEKILKKVDEIKHWEYPVLYLTFCHHFYNQLCGHCKSLPDAYSKHFDQSFGIDFPFTEFGEVVLKQLLDNTDGKRILIDIKHMSIAGRQIYLEFVEDMREKMGDNIPIIYSHGAVNGRRNFSVLPEDSSNATLNPEDLGLFDNEIIAIVKSDGIMGLNMDQKVLSNAANLSVTYRKAFGKPLWRRKYYWAGLLWNNLKHIAEILNAEGLSAWDHVTIGTDFDGAINTIHHFNHEKEMPSFYKYLEIHVEKYMMSPDCKLMVKNQLPPGEIIERLKYKNAMRFLKENLHPSTSRKYKVEVAT